jgi:hypothetical protein
MCECLKAPSVIAGFGCCGCKTYNGLQRKTCRTCSKERCTPLRPDKHTGESFETYVEAYKDDPERLKFIQAQMGLLPN